MLLAWSTGGGGKPPLLSLTLEMVMACFQYGSQNNHLLWFQPPQRRALQSNTSCHCSHSPRNSCTLLLLLPNALVTLMICLELITTSQGSATRSSLCHLPAGPWYCQEPSNQALTMSPTHCLLLPGNTLSTLLRIKQLTWKRQQISTSHAKN